MFWILGLDILFPILLPIFGGITVFTVFVGVLIMVAVQCSSRTDNASGFSEDYSAPAFTSPHPRLRPVFQIPMNCPMCQREIELNQVEWRDNRTIICPGCFADIEVSTSY